MLSVLYTLRVVSFTVGLFGGFLLLVCSEGIRARKILGGVMLAWGITYLLAAAAMEQGKPLSGREFMPVFQTITGVLGSGCFMFYLIEVIRPGWLTWKRVLLVFLPYLMSILIFYSVIALGVTPVRHLSNPADFITHLGEFNVWYRLVFLLVTIGYAIVMFSIFARYLPPYRKWTNENYSSTELMDISWMNYLLLGVTLVTVAYFWVIFSKAEYAIWCHISVIILFFAYTIYKGLFQQNPYPSDFFRRSLLEEDILASQDASDTDKIENDERFMQKMKEYRPLFEQWMEQEKPFLHTDFKLADVNARLPMNRTYMARFFSETYGCSFSHLVRQYRVKEVQRILRKNPHCLTKDIYRLCGFSSEAVFHRTFVEVTGSTPRQYRMAQKEDGDCAESI